MNIEDDTKSKDIEHSTWIDASSCDKNRVLAKSAGKAVSCPLLSRWSARSEFTGTDCACHSNVHRVVRSTI